MTSTCPPEADLARMLEDRLDGEEAAAVEAHVADCPDCRSTLERLTGGTIERTDTLWSPPSPDPTRVLPPGREGPGPAPMAGDGGAMAGPPGYRVVRELGRGGMGVVYLAHQVHADRPVALKMVLAGRGRPEDLLRFRLEGESLARLQHPNIVQVHEVGVADGRPFFSMEYVEGGTLAESISRGPRAPAEAAALAETLARAVHAAHQCGVVHRDLKPANVLLSGSPPRGPGAGGSRPGVAPGTPKITDFGLAKRVGSDSGLTHTGQILGTPSYMAPEQAAGGANVGISADVYALGAILYELLAGRPPFRGDTAWETMMRAVHEPAVPPSRLRSGIPRDLEVACLKCLAKGPAARYASADALAEDLRRFLAGESILARPSGVARRAWLWSRRRPAVAALLVALLASAVAGAAGVAVQWRRAERQRVAAEGARRDAVAARAATEAALARSDRARSEAEAVNRYLIEAFQRPDPSRDGRELKVVDLLDGAVERLDADHGGPAAVRGKLLDTLGQTFRGLGLPARAVEVGEEARRVLEAALGPRDVDALSACVNLAASYTDAGRTADAIALAEGVLGGRGAGLPPDDFDVLRARLALAAALGQAGRWDEAIALYRGASERLAETRPAGDPQLLAARHGLAGALGQAGRWAESAALQERVLSSLAVQLPGDHPRVIAARGNLALALGRTGRDAEAIRMDEETLRRVSAKFPPDHPYALQCRSSLAASCSRAGDPGRAISLHRETIRLLDAKFSPGHPRAIGARNSLVAAYGRAGRAGEALALAGETVQLCESGLGPDHPYAIQCRNNLAAACVLAGAWDRAIEVGVETVRRCDAKLPPDHPDTLGALTNLVEAYAPAGRWGEAVGVLERLFRTFRDKAGPDHEGAIEAEQGLALAHLRLGHPEVARPLLDDLLPRVRRRFGADSPRLADRLATIGGIMVDRGQAEAEPILRDCLAIRERTEPDSWATSNARSLLGAAIALRDEPEAAGLLLASGYEGMAAREATIPAEGRSNLPEAADRLVRFHEAAGHQEDAARWRGVRAKYAAEAPPPTRR